MVYICGTIILIFLAVLLFYAGRPNKKYGTYHEVENADQAKTLCRHAINRPEGQEHCLTIEVRNGEASEDVIQVHSGDGFLFASFAVAPSQSGAVFNVMTRLGFLPIEPEMLPLEAVMTMIKPGIYTCHRINGRDMFFAGLPEKPANIYEFVRGISVKIMDAREPKNLFWYTDCSVN